MSAPLPFVPPERTLTGGELQELAAAVAGAEGLWTDLLEHRTDGRGYAELFLDEHLGVWVLEWMADDHDTGYHDHDRSAGAVHVARGAIRHEHLRLGERPVGTRVPAGEGFRFDETFIHRMRREPDAGPTVTIHAYSPPLERTGQYGEAEDGLLHRVPTSSEEHLSPKGRQGTPSTFSDGDAEAEVGVEADERESGGPGS
ncbi:cysteine dioxygenase [Streptomyces sp. NPDC085932]|uniref:cysteine dioxygenase n=1 Tax=Streptomyces sp. NPDC085932 TaxID=3365741 RepID=UPI0037D8E894